MYYYLLLVYVVVRIGIVSNLIQKRKAKQGPGDIIDLIIALPESSGAKSCFCT